LRLTGSRRIPLAYYVLDVDTEGPPIGYLDGRPIPASVVDRAGLHYSYTGLAPRHRDGRLNVDALRPDEWIVAPALLYALDGSGEIA
jgi:hypothetical protein